MTEPISSPTNPRIKDLVRLRQRRERDRTGTFIVEGYRELRRAVAARVSLADLYVCPQYFLGGNEAQLVESIAATGTTITEVEQGPFQKASYRDRPEGLLAVARQFPTGLDGISYEGAPLLLVAERIEKPGNLGTMLRTAEAAGCTGVIVADPTTDPFNPNVVRASLGTLFSVPLAIAPSDAAIATLRDNEVRVVATTPDAVLPHFEADLTGAVAIVVGSEQYGLTSAWIEAADINVVIPMPGSVDSLNAAMAAGIVMFEALRQRS